MGMMAINCCKGCVAPKRYPGCHGRCPEYLEEKARWDELMAAERKKLDTQYGITSARSEAVGKALKSRRYSQKNYRRGSKSAQ